MSVFQDKPEAFFDVIVHDVGRSPGLTGACAGYEAGKWRHEQMADYLFDWLLEFTLKYSELEDVNSITARRMLRRAAKTVFNTPKYQKRGEFGELLLHALIREFFNSQPAISKIYYKSAINETVKGFDAVHIVENGDELELWLGEVKFYKALKAAISEVTDELKKHTDNDYLRSEFILIASKIDSRWKHADKLRSLISERTSLDKVFERVCIPVLITYESDCVRSHTATTELYRQALKAELEEAHSIFAAGGLPSLRIHLFLIPMHEKEALLKSLQDKLEGLQR